jgi:uncharacterized protein
MVEETIVAQISTDFQFLKNDPRILGIVLFGSYLTGQNTARSDIDICVVAPQQELYPIHKFIYENLRNNLDKYDIRFFEELPLYIKGEIIEKGAIILTRDIGELTEYFYPFRKQWEFEKWRIFINT